MRTRAIVALWIVIVGVARATADGGAPEQDAPTWHGAWLVEGTCSWRHVGRAGDGLVLEGRVAGFDVRLQGLPGRRGFALRGTATDDEEGLAHEARLVAEPEAGGGLRVRFDVEGRPSWRERWRRPQAPSLRLEVPRERRATEGPTTVTLAPGATRWRFFVHVEGRPQAVVVAVLAEDDPRYAHLGGVVHHEALGGGAVLPVGRHEVTWGGRDRSLDERAVLPGRYRVLVTADGGLLGPAPGEDDRPVVAEVTVVVTGPAPAAEPPPPPLVAHDPVAPPRPGLTHGLTRR